MIKNALKKPDFSTSFCFSSHLIYINKKMNETFFILSFVAVSFGINKTFYQNEFGSKLFLPPKL